MGKPFEDDNIICMFNGEIYNYSKFGNYKSDGECLIPLYKEYGDDFIKWNGITFPRETRNGKDLIQVDGQWKEAGDDFPWEKTANI